VGCPLSYALPVLAPGSTKIAYGRFPPSCCPARRNFDAAYLHLSFARSLSQHARQMCPSLPTPKKIGLAPSLLMTQRGQYGPIYGHDSLLFASLSIIVVAAGTACSLQRLLPLPRRERPSDRRAPEQRDVARNLMAAEPREKVIWIERGLAPSRR
jgi:hypothetical protein